MNKLNRTSPPIVTINRRVGLGRFDKLSAAPIPPPFPPSSSLPKSGRSAQDDGKGAGRLMAVTVFQSKAWCQDGLGFSPPAPEWGLGDREPYPKRSGVVDRRGVLRMRRAKKASIFTEAQGGYLDFRRSLIICLPISRTLFFGSHFRRSRV